MPVNRNALIRYKTLDNCLRNRFRKWTLDDLIDACSEALYDYEGIEKGVSKRTVQMDLQVMRSDKLGYHAPIVVEDKKYYIYADPDYSITNIPLTDQDLSKLTEAVDFLKQFKGFTHFQGLSGMIQKLEDKIQVSKTKERPVIDLEKNENLKGLEHIDPIFQAITQKQYIILTYQSFRARTSSVFNFHPALLKEYRNRWFVLGKKKKDAGFMLLALDRIESLERSINPAIAFDPSTVSEFFQDVIGVSVNIDEAPQEVILAIDHSNAPYVLTKPIHHSQQLIKKTDHGILISLQVQLNYELEREILGFGDTIKVISPSQLRARIKEKLNHALDLYATELHENALRDLAPRLANKGHALLNHIYTRRELGRIGIVLRQYKKEHPSESEAVYAIRNLFSKIPDLQQLVLNENIKKILNHLGEGYFVTKALFFNKPPQSNWFVTWHQDQTINVKEKKELNGYSGWTKKGDLWGVCPPNEILHNTLTIRIHLDDTTEENGALHVIPGSHKQSLMNDEIQLITQSALSSTCEVNAGGIHLMKPLLLHASSKTTNQKSRRVLHLEFSNATLPEGLEWGEILHF